VTRGGHAHYLISKSGVIYRILDPKYWANHAGVSMWQGYENLSDCSVGIELEGYHDVAFSHAQYASLRQLLSILQRRYGVEDRDVLEHWRIAYSAPNQYHHNRVRGRKSDPGINNFDRAKAGLTDTYSIDPDVIAGRIAGRSALMKAGGHVPANATEDDEDNENVQIPTEVVPSGNRITSTRTAWQIAGAKYNSPSTKYLLPDGRTIVGNEIADWSDIPPGTEVILGSSDGAITKVVSEFDAKTLVPQISPAQSAWKIANVLYNSSMTYYLLPNGSVLSGAELSKVSNLPEGTRVLVAYRLIKGPRTSNPLGEDLNATFVSPQTLYLFPNGALRSGDQIEDFSKLPQELRVFTKID
jgi:N-acetylmuramoyl-L-alanine amidase